MTVLLSFYDWGQYKGIVPEFTLKNFRDLHRFLFLRDLPAHLPDRDPGHAG
jgi:hypothetical protein